METYTIECLHLAWTFKNPKMSQKRKQKKWLVNQKKVICVKSNEEGKVLEKEGNKGKTRLCAKVKRFRLGEAERNREMIFKTADKSASENRVHERESG